MLNVALCEANIALCEPNLALCKPNLALCKPNLALCEANIALCEPNLALCAEEAYSVCVCRLRFFAHSRYLIDLLMRNVQESAVVIGTFLLYNKTMMHLLALQVFELSTEQDKPLSMSLIIVQ